MDDWNSALRLEAEQRRDSVKTVKLSLTREQETTLAVMLITEAGRAEDRARRIEKLRPDSRLSTAARKSADERLDIYNQFNIARNMPTVTADEI